MIRYKLARKTVNKNSNTCCEVIARVVRTCTLQSRITKTGRSLGLSLVGATDVKSNYKDLDLVLGLVKTCFGASQF